MENEGEDMQQMSEMSDSRKRPYSDGTEHHFAKKRPNPGAGDGSVLLKQLIPSVIAGVIIGKGGESITKLQANTETVVKMSKSGDFYPGTTDRVCVITGFPDNVRNAHNIIWEHIREKCDKSNEEFKVRLVVPNLTVGMIIGKSGCYVKQIKEETGANVQISQKAQDSSLVERVVTVNGAIDQASAAFDMVFKMIISDPQSGSCPNVSYSDFRGPVPNASPMGSPYANSMMDMTTKSMMNHLAIDALKATLRG